MHTWVFKYEQLGLAGLADRSHRPVSCPHQITREVPRRTRQRLPRSTNAPQLDPGLTKVSVPGPVGSGSGAGGGGRVRLGEGPDHDRSGPFHWWARKDPNRRRLLCKFDQTAIALGRNTGNSTADSRSTLLLFSAVDVNFGCQTALYSGRLLHQHQHRSRRWPPLDSQAWGRAARIEGSPLLPATPRLVRGSNGASRGRQRPV